MEETQNELQPSFIVDGVEYYPLSQAVARRVVFEDSGVDVASLDEPFVIVPNANDGETSVYNAQSGGSGDSGGETSVWTLDFNGEVTTSLGALASLGIENALLERATTVSGGASFGENGASGGAASGGGDEIDGVEALANLVTGDATYGVTVDFEALYNSESNYDAQPTVDYALSTSPLATESADA